MVVDLEKNTKRKGKSRTWPATARFFLLLPYLSLARSTHLNHVNLAGSLCFEWPL
jgi:hypothetical protein